MANLHRSKVTRRMNAVIAAHSLTFLIAWNLRHPRPLQKQCRHQFSSLGSGQAQTNLNWSNSFIKSDTSDYLKSDSISARAPRTYSQSANSAKKAFEVNLHPVSRSDIVDGVDTVDAVEFLTFLRLTLSVEAFYSIRKRWWRGRIRKDDDDDASLLLCRRLYPHSTWAYQVSGISTFVLNVSHHLPRSTQPYFSSQWWWHGFRWHFSHWVGGLCFQHQMISVHKCGNGDISKSNLPEKGKLGPICRQIGEGPNLPENGKLGPICPKIGKGTNLPENGKLGPICRQIGEGPNLPRTSLGPGRTQGRGGRLSLGG